MAPIRVLQILHSMNRGGAENAIMNYYRHIDREKVQFDFLLTEPEKCQFEDEIRELGGRVYRVPLLTIRNPFPYLRSVSRFFRDHPEFRIVHSHTSSKSFFPLWMAKRAGVPVRICHSHNTQSESGMRGWIRDGLKGPLKRVATCLFACGEEAAFWLYGRETVKAGRVRVVPNVIECGRFVFDEARRSRIRSGLHLPDSTLLLGCTARFSHQKNHRFCVSLFAAFHERFPDSRLVLLGDGDLREDITRQVAEAGLTDSVIFTGVVPNVADYEQAMDFFLMPSFHEGLPVSLIEAQVSGLRCFVSDGVTREADKTGLVTFLPLEKGPAYWAEEIASAIGYTRRSHLDEVRVAGYDAETGAGLLEDFYLNEYQRVTNEN